METTTPQGIKFSDSDIVNIDDCCWRGQYNPHNVHPFVLHDHGFVVAVVFASNLQDALDEAVDGDKMERYLITDADRADYSEDDERISYLGNAGEAHDIESLGVEELENPTLSFCACFRAQFGKWE